MIAYIPIPNNSIVSQISLDALLKQVDKVETIECGEYRRKNDGRRFIDIGKGRIEGMRRAVKSGEPFFVVQNAGALHISGKGVSTGVDFLKKNPDWAAVSLLPQSMKDFDYDGYVKGECVVYRTDAVKEIEKDIDWTRVESEGKKIKNALHKQGWKFGYLALEYGHIRDIGLATFHKNGDSLNPKGVYKNDPKRKELDKKREESITRQRNRRAERMTLKDTDGKLCN